jgi:hypothetical protein
VTPMYILCHAARATCRRRDWDSRRRRCGSWCSTAT